MKALLLTLLAAGLVAAGPQASFADDDEGKKKGRFGVGASGRHLLLTRGLAEVVTEIAPGGTRTRGGSIEFSKRGRELEFVLGFGYDDLNATTGYYLETAGEALTPGKVDFTEFRKFHWWTIDALLVGYLDFHPVFALRYGAGLGVAIPRGRILRTDSLCTSDNIQFDCVPDPDGQQQREEIKLPVAMPVLSALVGLQFRPIKALAINLDVGLHTVPYVGGSVMFYLW